MYIIYDSMSIYICICNRWIWLNMYNLWIYNMSIYVNSNIGYPVVGMDQFKRTQEISTVSQTFEEGWISYHRKWAFTGSTGFTLGFEKAWASREYVPLRLPSITSNLWAQTNLFKQNIKWLIVFNAMLYQTYCQYVCIGTLAGWWNVLFGEIAMNTTQRWSGSFWDCVAD